MPSPNARFSYELSSSTGGGAGVTFNLTITDAVSDIVVLEARFSAEDFANLLGGRVSGQGIETYFVPEEDRGRIGKHHAIASVRLPLNAAKDIEELEGWAEQVQRWVIPCAYTSVRRHGGAGGWVVTLTEFLATKEDARIWAEQRQAVLEGLNTPAELREKKIELRRTPPSQKG